MEAMAAQASTPGQQAHMIALQAWLEELQAALPVAQQYAGMTVAIPMTSDAMPSRTLGAAGASTSLLIVPKHHRRLVHKLQSIGSIGARLRS